MAVQKSRVTRSRRGMRRSHDGLKKSTLSVDSNTGETHLRHHVSPKGIYKGRQITREKAVNVEEDNDEE
jgi:large subunit ribosomal protein L32